MGEYKLYLQLSHLHSLTCAPPRPTPPWPPRPCTADTGPAWHGRRGSPGTTWLGLGRVCNVYLNNHICPLELATDIREVSDSRQGAFSGYCEIFADLCCRLCCPPPAAWLGINWLVAAVLQWRTGDLTPGHRTQHSACRHPHWGTADNITTYDIIFV